MRRQFALDFIGFGNFLVARMAYVFIPDLYGFQGELTTSVTALIWPESAGDPKGLSFFGR